MENQMENKDGKSDGKSDGKFKYAYLYIRSGTKNTQDEELYVDKIESYIERRRSFSLFKP